MAITESFKQNVVTLKLNLAILPYIPFTLTYPQNLYIEDNRKKCKFFVIPQNNTYSLKVPHLGKTHVLVAWTDAQTGPKPCTGSGVTRDQETLQLVYIKICRKIFIVLLQSSYFCP